MRAFLGALLWAAGLFLLIALPRIELRAQQAPLDDLDRLVQLSANGASKQGGGSAGDWASRCRAQIQSVTAYRSLLVKRDYSMPHLESRNFAYVEWRLEVVRPDRIHVRQGIHEQPPLGELTEERIAIGPEHFLSGSPWTKMDAQSAADYAVLNHFLTIEKFGEMLSKSKFNLLGVVTLGEGQYVVLESDNVRMGDYPMLSEFENVKGRARVWIDADTGTLAKVEIEYRGKDASGEPLHKAFVQVFANYNEPVAINVPATKPR